MAHRCSSHDAAPSHLERWPHAAGPSHQVGNLHLRIQLVESAWGYQHGPAVGVEEASLPDRGPRLGAHRRELCGFLWAEMTA
jgi:hypothetical protein